jgi:hypothetical protein
MMKKFQIAALLITLTLPVMAFAGAPPSGPDNGPPGFDGPGDLQQLAITKGSIPDHAKTAIIEYLDLSEAQIEAWDILIDETTTLAEPMRDRVREINDELKNLFESDDPPADVIGEYVIERHGLLEELFWLHRDYVDEFEHVILTEDQHRQYHLVRAAARVQPLIPAFRVFALIPPRR